MLSVVHKGEVLDFHYERWDLGYKFYVGDIFIGLLIKQSNHRWDAINYYIDRLKNKEGFGNVSGFGSRLLAAEYLLRVNNIGGFGRSDEDRRETIELLQKRIEEKS